MKIRTIGVGAAFTGAVIAGSLGAGSASAAPSETGNGPGISYSANGGPSNGFGNGVSTVTKGENGQALAIRTGLVPGATSHAAAYGDGATAVSIDGYTVVNGSNSHGFTGWGHTDVTGADNNVVTMGGTTNLDDRNTLNDKLGRDAVHGNFVVNWGSDIQQDGQRVTDQGVTSLSFCGVGGQGDHITVSAGANCD